MSLPVKLNSSYKLQSYTDSMFYNYFTEVILQSKDPEPKRRWPDVGRS